MSGRFVDFDEMWRESMPEEAEAPKVRIMGEEITLPPVLPARLMLRIMRNTFDDGSFAERTQEMIKDLTAVYGEERVTRWIDSGITTAQMWEIAGHTYRLYTPERPGDDAGDEGNGETPEEGAKVKKPQSKRSSESGH